MEQELKNNMSAILSLIHNDLENAGLSIQAEDIGILIDHGESGIALEQICSHLEEKSISISGQVFDLIEICGNDMELPPSTWEHLTKP